MKAWSSWFPDLAPFLPGCPNIVMAHELRRAAQAFFSKTRAWRVDQALKPVTAGTEVVEIRPDSNEQDLVEIEAAWYDARQMEPVTPQSLDARFVQGWHDHTGTPSEFLSLLHGQLRLYPIPLADAQQGLRVRLVVTPSDLATGLPDDIAARYRDEIQVGAKARLMLMPGKPWTNPELAAVHGQAFGSMVEQENIKAARAHVKARIPSRPNWC